MSKESQKNISIVEFDRLINGNFHKSTPVYNELIYALTSGLTNEGYKVNFLRNRLNSEQINIIFGFHRILADLSNIKFNNPKKIIFFNSEPLINYDEIYEDRIKREKWKEYADFLNKYPVIDYSSENIADKIYSRVLKFNFGYYDFKLPKFDKKNELLFFGHMNEFRTKKINEISSLINKEIKIIKNEWGFNRDKLICESNFILNLPRLETKKIYSLEHIRIWYSLCLGANVLCQKCDNLKTFDEYKNYIYFYESNDDLKNNFINFNKEIKVLNYKKNTNFKNSILEVMNFIESL